MSDEIWTRDAVKRADNHWYRMGCAGPWIGVFRPEARMREHEQRSILPVPSAERHHALEALAAAVVDLRRIITNSGSWCESEVVKDGSAWHITAADDRALEIASDAVGAALSRLDEHAAPTSGKANDNEGPIQ